MLGCRTALPQGLKHKVKELNSPIISDWFRGDQTEEPINIWRVPNQLAMSRRCLIKHSVKLKSSKCDCFLPDFQKLITNHRRAQSLKHWLRIRKWTFFTDQFMLESISSFFLSLDLSQFWLWVMLSLCLPPVCLISLGSYSCCINTNLEFFAGTLKHSEHRPHILWTSFEHFFILKLVQWPPMRCGSSV